MNKTARISLILAIVVGIALAVLAAYQLLPAYFKAAGAVIIVIAWGWTLMDIARNKIYNKQFWMLSMVFLAPLAAVMYLIQREHLIHLGEKFGTGGRHRSNFSKK